MECRLVGCGVWDRCWWWDVVVGQDGDGKGQTGLETGRGDGKGQTGPTASHPITDPLMTH